MGETERPSGTRGETIPGSRRLALHPDPAEGKPARQLGNQGIERGHLLVVFSLECNSLFQRFWVVVVDTLPNVVGQPQEVLTHRFQVFKDFARTILHALTPIQTSEVLETSEVYSTHTDFRSLGDFGSLLHANGVAGYARSTARQPSPQIAGKSYSVAGDSDCQGSPLVSWPELHLGILRRAA